MYSCLLVATRRIIIFMCGIACNRTDSNLKQSLYRF